MAKTFKELKNLKEFVENEREKNRKIVFTNGCFDIIHAGHVDYLERAKNLGDILVVGVNSDISIRKIKGDKRPIVPLNYRLKVLSSLKVVDALYTFNEETPINVIKAIKPDILVKGADWELDRIIGKKYAKTVKTIPFKYDISTSKIIEKVLKLYSKNK